MPARTRSSLPVWSMHACHSPRSSEIICGTRTVAVDPSDENQDDRSAWILLFFVCCLECTPSASARPWTLAEKKTKWKLTFFPDPTWATFIKFLFVMHANAIFYKLARANVCIVLNWICSTITNYHLAFILKLVFLFSVPPRITPGYSHQVIAFPGEKVALVCPVDPRYRSIISWKKNNQFIDDNGSRRGISMHRQRLIIRKAHPTDSGIYTCIATNGFGSARALMQLVVFSKIVDDAHMMSFGSNEILPLEKANTGASR